MAKAMLETDDVAPVGEMLDARHRAHCALLAAIATACAAGTDPRAFCEGYKLLLEAEATRTLADHARAGS